MFKMENHLKCDYISGIVLDSNIADRRMKINLIDPRIVLIEGNITLDDCKTSFLDIESIVKQEKHYLKSIEKSLLTIKPNVMIVEDEISRRIVEKIRDKGIFLIMNIHKDDLKMLA